MSHEGKMRRGAFYQNSKNNATNIASDVKYFLKESNPEKPSNPEKFDSNKPTKKKVKDGSN